jgi:cellulose synthase/poly-beta-1,6-N-acetylglucosamine synthase-like glycosyltransferase
MYLAEDRILSLGIYCQMNSKYVLRYVPDAKAYTDPMKTEENLINQRRRWINSSLFAFLYVYKNYYFNVMDSEHNFFRRYLTLNLSMHIALFSLFNTYITPSLYFFILYVTVYQMGFDGSEWVAKAACLVYLFVFFAAVGGALTGRQWSKRASIVSKLFAIFTVLMILLVFYNLVFIYFRVTHNPAAHLRPN